MKHIRIDEVFDKPIGVRTRRWEVFSIRDEALLGRIQWRTAWRQYTFQPCFPTVFEEECLRDIAKFLEDNTVEHKHNLIAIKHV